MAWQTFVYSNTLDAWMPRGEPVETHAEADRALLWLRIQRPGIPLCAHPFETQDELVGVTDRLNAGETPPRTLFIIPAVDEDGEDSPPPELWQRIQSDVLSGRHLASSGKPAPSPSA